MPRKVNTKPIRPSFAVEQKYRQRLDALIEEMANSTRYWVTAQYRRDPPRIAMDGPSLALARAVRGLAQRWQRRFNKLAVELARYFTLQAAARSDIALRSSLARGGMSVRFTMTPAMRDVQNAIIAENVNLIRSIPQHYFTQIQGAVMRSVSEGRDLASLSSFFQHQLGVTKRRAAFISRDQSNKATSLLARARQLELGITQSRWVHSGGGKHPRPTHVKAGHDGVVFDLREGWLDPAINKRIWPGTEINCRCISRPVIPGFS
jgi:uncharacterized protein with gpF-like domain